jgi:hypothetical protein
LILNGVTRGCALLLTGHEESNLRWNWRNVDRDVDTGRFAAGQRSPDCRSQCADVSNLLCMTPERSSDIRVAGIPEARADEVIGA